ncbi:hypothetical protein CKF54_05320 [Psittacicella hinzii]|uniref:Uncharacterized protein n=1 Tax=Psittacicella hinzii TaxID=2028575 RepID=A0A3A1Y3Z2_9GAMM|nr:glycosyltransferase [Psittacicella hinzii]RIY32130.1 hypothetical protein CKF54_05320 [Psittacicella hinzii]
MNQLAFNTNDTFLEHLEVLLKNYISFNRQPFRAIIIHNIADADNSPYVQKFCQAFADYPNIELKFHYLDSNDLLKLGLSEKQAKNVANYRLLLPTLPYHGTVLYLDIDMMITGNIEELFKPSVLQGKSLGIVSDTCNYADTFMKYRFFNERFIPELLACKFTPDNQYFNSGLLLVDLDKLRERGQAEYQANDVWSVNLGKYLDRPTLLPDQDFLNIVHYQDKTFLDWQYNYPMKFLISQRYTLQYFGWDKTHAKALADKKIPAPYIPKILHFLEKNKQWNSTAPEWIDYYNFYAKQSVGEILAQPVEFYQEKIEEILAAYGYLPSLIDLGDAELFRLGREERFKAWTKKDWQQNPFFLNIHYFRIPKFFARHSLKKRINSANNQVLLDFNQNLYARVKNK